MAAAPPQKRSAVIASAVTDAPNRLGVGFIFNRAAETFVSICADAFDYLVVIPDLCYAGDPGRSSFSRGELEAWVRTIDRVAASKPIVAHHIGLSIGTAAHFDVDYVRHMGRWCREYACPWHSEHLSFVRVPDANGQHRHIGVALPLPYDDEVLDLVSERVAVVQDAARLPLLLENSVYYFALPGEQMTEPQFLNALCARTGCGLLLDLHNLHVNATNHRFSAHEFVDELDLANVVEIHVAGGNEVAGMYTDSHAGACPEAVWRLLEYVVPRASRLSGVTFEYHESYFVRLGEPGLRAQLGRAREIFPQRVASCP
jgi:uncharacterized protein (UPF0276 family)